MTTMNVQTAPTGAGYDGGAMAARGLISQAVCSVLAAAMATVAPMARAADSPSEETAEILVTGSRIRQDGFTSSAPISVLDSSAIQGVGATSVGDVLSRVPSIISDTDSSSDNVASATNSGLHTTALRNLGSSRTLVLVNGRRYVSGMSPSAGYGVDLNTIPTTMIERIEVLTGGQSAVYGSDAVAGVVNIITRTDFEGVKLHAQTSSATAGDRAKVDADFTVGSNFKDDGNVWMSMGYSQDDGLRSSDRRFSQRSEWSVDTDADGLLDSFDFLGSGFIPQSRFVGGGVNIKGDGTPYVDARDALNFNDYRWLILPMERKFAAGGLNMRVNERTKATVEVSYAQVATTATIESVPLRVPRDVYFVDRGGTTGIDLRTHPLFVGSSVASQLIGAGITSLDRVTTFERVEELGPLVTHNVRSNFRAVSAFDIELGDRLNLNIYGTYGVTTQDQTNSGDINIERAAYALDIEPNGFGGYRCANPAARIQGCVPFNPFDTVDSIAGLAGVTGYSPEALRYLSADGFIAGRVEQIVVSSVLSGDLPWSIGGHGIGFAAGLEYREERGSETPDGFRQQGLNRLARMRPTDGRYDVVEAFGELSLPVFERLTVDLAARAGEYSSIGSAASWRAGLNAPVTNSVRLRASAATALRAPNVSDLYAGASANPLLLFDPCGGVTATTSGDTATNCRSIQAIQDRVLNTGAFTLTQVELQQAQTYSTGSTEVKEETVDSLTLGVAFTPVSFDQLSVSVDYYQIEIDDAINSADGTTILNRCYSVSPGVFDPTCGGTVLRDPFAGQLLEVYTKPTNQDSFDVAGVDMELAYRFGYIGPGLLTANLSANFLTKFEVTGTAGDVQNLRGEVLYPKLRSTLNLEYVLSDFSVFAQVRHRSSTKDRNDNTTMTEAMNSIDSATYLDVRGSYRFSELVSVYLGVNNVLDSSPPLMGFSHKYYQQAINTNASAFDVVGRQAFVGLDIQF